MWHMSLRGQQKGQLDQAEYFEPGEAEYVACEVRIPIKLDPNDIKTAILHATALAIPNPRSFEIWWDGQNISIVLVATKNDLLNYQNAFKSMYPSIGFESLKTIVPEWYNPSVTSYEIFDVGYTHGHYFASFDNTKAHVLITQIAKSIQTAKHGWIQIVFRTSPTFSKMLSRQLARLDRMYQKVQNTKYLSFFGGLVGATPHMHPENNADFARSYKTLRTHAEQKGQNQHIQMSFRGLVDGRMDLDTSVIETIPVENVRTTFEHLSKFTYPFQRFHCNDMADKKQTIRTLVKTDVKKEIIPRIDIFKRRLLPNTKKWNDKLLRYCETNIVGLYHKRITPPYLILNNSELPIFIHVPDPTTPNIKTGRTAMMPIVLPDKEVFDLGTIDNPYKK